MNNYQFLLLLFLTVQGYSQSLEERLRDEICLCYTEQFRPNMDDFHCFEPLMLHYGEEMEAFLSDKANRTFLEKPLDETVESWEILEEYLDYVTLKYQAYFFENCGKYFETIKWTHNEGIRLTLENLQTPELEKLNEYIATYEYNSNFILERGMYYLKHKEFTKALADFNALIDEDSKDPRAHVWKAVTLFQDGQYLPASDVYLKLYELTHESRFVVHSELMKYLDGKE